jgi:hypothetical protein
MSDSNYHYESREFVGVMTPGWVYVGIKSREAFDMIDAPVKDQAVLERVIAKPGVYNAG